MEYEYSYIVKDLTEILDYVGKKYDFIEKRNERRTIYKKKESIARVTVINGEMFLDFKENKMMYNGSVERKESQAIKFENLEACEDILDFLNYEKDDTIVRDRSIFEGEGIKFEIDEYYEPEKSFVVSFEGDKEVCDKFNEEFKELYEKYKVEK